MYSFGALGRRSPATAPIPATPASVFAQIQDAIARNLGTNVIDVLVNRYNAFVGTRADDILLSYRRWTFWFGQTRDQLPLRIMFTVEIPPGVSPEDAGEAIFGLFLQGQVRLKEKGLSVYLGVAPEGSPLPTFIVRPGR